MKAFSTTSALDSLGSPSQALYYQGNHLWHPLITACWAILFANVDVAAKRTIPVFIFKELCIYFLFIYLNKLI
jgi:hypothetical protein